MAADGVADRVVLEGGRGVWSATPWDYSSLRFLHLSSEGVGELTYGYGQTIYAKIRCRWKIASPGLLRLEYLDSPAYQFFRGFTPDPAGAVRDLEYRLVEGEVSGVESIVARPFRYLWTLELSEPPWPTSLKFPREAPRVFYGHREAAG
jgi:hypothetical protein